MNRYRTQGMGETDLYMTSKPLNKFGTHIQFDALGAPPGTSMSPQVAELLRGLPEQLLLASIGISTPWAGRVSDVDWKEITDPDTNIQTFLISDMDLIRAQQALFGHPIPFVVIKSLDPVPQATLDIALEGSPYEFFETQAVYRQDDANPVPRIEFFHWVRRRPLDEEGGKSMSAVVAEVGGDLLFGQQVPVEATKLREPPAISFQEAFDAQFLLPPPATPGVPEPGPVAPVPEPEKPVSPPRSPAQMPSWGPLLVVGTIALAGVVLWQTTRRKR